MNINISIEISDHAEWHDVAETVKRAGADAAAQVLSLGVPRLDQDQWLIGAGEPGHALAYSGVIYRSA